MPSLRLPPNSGRPVDDGQVSKLDRESVASDTGSRREKREWFSRKVRCVSLRKNGVDSVWSWPNKEREVHSFKNSEAIRRACSAESRGASLEELKPLYMEQNVFDIGLDDSIFRIFQLHYLQNDIAAGTLTLVPAHPDQWEDPLENPLLKASYLDVETGRKITFGGALDFHALSWTKTKEESDAAWSKFSHGKPAVRIGSTPRLLLERLMDIEDQWFVLRYHMGLVRYESKEAIEKWIAQPDFSVHLDSLGQDLALSLMLLRTCYEDEEEVRLLFSKLNHSASEWASAKIKMSGRLAVVPFLWSGAIQNLTFGSKVTSTQQTEFMELIQSRGISCPCATSTI
jgi:hypothetical protein